ncbi:hypothetical protein, partial [Streptomyces sp. NPDC048720]|uniref:hypothetical protein n=1 Tax=Streptomyces sp. NPDC048720 TaxID=3365588 RepID=UPI0037232620
SGSDESGSDTTQSGSDESGSDTTQSGSDESGSDTTQSGSDESGSDQSGSNTTQSDSDTTQSDSVHSQSYAENQSHSAQWKKRHAREGILVRSHILSKSERDDLVKQLKECLSSVATKKIPNPHAKAVVKGVKTTKDIYKSRNDADEAVREAAKNLLPYGGCYLGHVRQVE